MTTEQLTDKLSYSYVHRNMFKKDIQMLSEALFNLQKTEAALTFEFVDIIAWSDLSEPCNTFKQAIQNKLDFKINLYNAKCEEIRELESLLESQTDEA